MFCGTMVYAVCKMQWNNLLNIVEYLKTSWFSARAEWTEGTNRSKCKSVNMNKYAFSFLLYILLRKKKKKRRGTRGESPVFSGKRRSNWFWSDRSCSFLWPSLALGVPCARDLRLAEALVSETATAGCHSSAHARVTPKPLRCAACSLWFFCTKRVQKTNRIRG